MRIKLIYEAAIILIIPELMTGCTPDKQCIYFSKNDFWKAKKGYPDGSICLPGGLGNAVGDLKDAKY